MKAIVISCVLSFLFVFVLSAQQSGQITVEKKGIKKIYMHDEESINSNGNPFAQPPAIASNIVNGKGIFTFLSYDRKTLVINP